MRMRAVSRGCRLNYIAYVPDSHASAASKTAPLPRSVPPRPLELHIRTTMSAETMLAGCGVLKEAHGSIGNLSITSHYHWLSLSPHLLHGDSPDDNQKARGGEHLIEGGRPG
jgi:hypothetical protein